MSLDQTDDAIDPVDATGNQRTPLTKSRPEVVRESPNNVFSPLSVASEATAPGDNSVDSSFSSENVGGSVTPSPIVRRDADVAASAGDDVEVGVSVSFASTGDGDNDDSSGWLRRRRVSGAVAPGLSANASLLTSLAPSADEATLHRRVSELRLALRTAEGALDKTRARFDAAEASRSEAEREAAALRARVWTLEGAEALSGARLHDGSLDFLRGELLNEATEELEEAARATAEAETRARGPSTRSGAPRTPPPPWSPRRARKWVALARGCAGAFPRAGGVQGRHGRARGARRGGRGARARRRRRRPSGATPARAPKPSATRRALATRAASDAEAAREAVETATASEEEAVRHNTWLQQRVRELEEGEGADAGARYGAELRRLREKLAADAAKAADTLATERAARRELEARLADATRDDDAERGGDAPAAADASAEAELRARVAELEARLAAAAGDERGDALGLDSDEESSSVKNAADAPARTVATATAETQADDDALEEARRDVARLREANEDLLARQQHAAAAAAAAASPAAIDAALSRNNAAWATKLAQSELAVTEAEEKSERAARRVAALEAECETAKRDLLEIRTREIAVEDQEAAVAAAAEEARAEAERSASARWEHEVLEAKRAATEARGELKRVVEADSEREREANEAEKEWEEKLTEARRAAALAESRRDEAEATVAEAKEAATRAIVRVEEQKEDEIAEARRVAAVAEAKMAEAEASAAEAKEAEANAAVRVAELGARARRGDARDRAHARAGGDRRARRRGGRRVRRARGWRRGEDGSRRGARAGARRGAHGARRAGRAARVASPLEEPPRLGEPPAGRAGAARQTRRAFADGDAARERLRRAARVRRVAHAPRGRHGGADDDGRRDGHRERGAGGGARASASAAATRATATRASRSRWTRRCSARSPRAPAGSLASRASPRTRSARTRGTWRRRSPACAGPPPRRTTSCACPPRTRATRRPRAGRGGAREAREAREGTPEHAPGHRETRRREMRHRARDPSPPRMSFDASEGASLASEAFAAVAASARGRRRRRSSRAAAARTPPAAPRTSRPSPRPRSWRRRRSRRRRIGAIAGGRGDAGDARVARLVRVDDDGDASPAARRRDGHLSRAHVDGHVGASHRDVGASFPDWDPVNRRDRARRQASSGRHVPQPPVRVRRESVSES